MFNEYYKEWLEMGIDLLARRFVEMKSEKKQIFIERLSYMNDKECFEKKPPLDIG